MLCSVLCAHLEELAGARSAEASGNGNGYIAYNYVFLRSSNCPRERCDKSLL